MGGGCVFPPSQLATVTSYHSWSGMVGLLRGHKEDLDIWMHHIGTFPKPFFGSPKVLYQRQGVSRCSSSYWPAWSLDILIAWVVEWTVLRIHRNGTSLNIFFGSRRGTLPKSLHQDLCLWWKGNWRRGWYEPFQLRSLERRQAGVGCW